MLIPNNAAAQIKKDYDRDGYIHLPGFLNADEVRELLANLDRFVREVVPGLPKTDVFYEDKSQSTTLKQLIRINQHDGWFGRMMDDSDFTRLAELLLGRKTASRNMQYFNKPPRIGLATPPHQDGYYWMIDPCEGLTMWLALEEVDEENGCVRYARGSHLRGMRPHSRTQTLGFSQGISDFPNADDRASEVVTRARPGDLLVHDARTVHWADANTSASRTRKAMGLVYFSDRAKVDAEASAAYQKKLAEELEKAGKI
ncbi:MAG: phytanoyl-CoA dioxygenase family protein [Opitutaceae bacterium]